MDRTEVVEIITALGFVSNGQPESTEGNDSLYQHYLRGDGESLWLGNAFLEVEWQSVALDYRHENEAALHCFIRGHQVPATSDAHLR